MNKYSKFYLSAQTHGNAVPLLKVKTSSVDAFNNTSIERSPIPTMLAMESFSPTGTEFEVAFYPFKMTNIIHNGQLFYFKHKLNKAVFPFGISIEDSSGVVVDPIYYYYKENGEDVYLYHNLVNKAGSYYFVKYPRKVDNGMIDYAYTEILRATPVMTEVPPGFEMGVNNYQVNIGESTLTVTVKNPGNYHLYYLNKQALFFSSRAEAKQPWHLCVKKFAYKHPVSSKVFSTVSNYYKEEFHPYVGVNFVIEKDVSIDENDVIKTVMFPLFFTEVEFRIWDLDYNVPVPIRSLDPNTGFIQVNRDDMPDPTATKLNIAYYISQEHIVLNKTNVALPQQDFVEFNPAINPAIQSQYVLTYVRRIDAAGEGIHQAIFEPSVYNGKQGLYLKSIVPYDADHSKYISNSIKISFEDFVNNFDVLSNVDKSDNVLILGLTLVHNNTDVIKFFNESIEDPRVLGGGIQEDLLIDVITGYPETRYYWDVQPHEGDIIPAMATFMALVPSNLLTFFETDDIKSRIMKHAGAGRYPIMLTDTNGIIERIE